MVDMRRAGELIYLGDPVLAERLTVVEHAGGDGWETGALRSEVQETVTLCSPEDNAEPTAGVFGIVYAKRPDRLAGATVVARWQTQRRLVADEWRWTDQERATSTDADGFFRVCGLPAAQSIDVVISAPDGATHTVTVQTPRAGRDARLEVAVVP